jgi:hypothetical protein
MAVRAINRSVGMKLYLPAHLSDAIIAVCVSLEQTMTKRRRTVEKPSGRGRIIMTVGKAVNVRYSLVVIQFVDEDADTGPIASQLEIRGAIEVDGDQGMIDLAGQQFTLKTNDSRCLEAWAKKGDPVTRQWEIATTAPSKGLTPC